MSKVWNVVIVSAALLFLVNAADAKPKSPITKYNQLTLKQQNGLDACYAWCNEHNATLNSQAACGSKCWDYWSHHQG